MTEYSSFEEASARTVLKETNLDSKLESLASLEGKKSVAELDTDRVRLAVSEAVSKEDVSVDKSDFDDLSGLTEAVKKEFQKFAADSVPELRDFIIQPMEESLRDQSLTEREIRQAYEEAGDQFFR